MEKPKITFTEEPLSEGSSVLKELANSVLAATKKKKKDAVTPKMLKGVIKRIVEQGVDITDNYANYFNVGMAIANTFGEEGREYFHQLCQFYPKYDKADVDAKYDNFLKTSDGSITGATLLMIAKGHGIDTKGLTSSHANEVIDYLLKHHKFRENVRTSRVEFTATPDDNDNVWIPMTEKHFTTFFTEIISRNIKVTRGDLHAIIRSEIVSQSFDILEDYFAALPAYNDSMAGAIDEMFDHLILADDEDRELCRMMFRKWFINMVARWLFGDTDTQAMLCLIGVQNAGKTYFMKHILPPVLSQYMDVVLPNEDFRDKDRKLTLSEKLLLVFDEWIISRKMSNIIKSVTSLANTSLRDAFGHFRENRDCISSFSMTSNEEQPLSVREGNRRYCTIHIVGTLDLNKHPLNYEYIYAEALHLIKSGYEYHFTKEEVVRISAHNEKYTEQTACEAAIIRFYRKPEMHETGIMVGTADIIEQIRGCVPPVELTPQNIGSAMKHLGYISKRSNGSARYYVFELTYDDNNKLKNETGRKMKEEISGKDTDAQSTAAIPDDPFTEGSANDELFLPL